MSRTKPGRSVSGVVAVSGTRIRHRSTAETRKDTASTKTERAAPTAPTRAAPALVPALSATEDAAPSFAFASWSRSGSTMAGKRLIAAASCTTLAAPSTIATAHSCPMVRIPAEAAAGTVTSAPAATRSDAISWGRLGCRSDRAPAHSATAFGRLPKNASAATSLVDARGSSPVGAGSATTLTADPDKVTASLPSRIRKAGLDHAVAFDFWPASVMQPHPALQLRCDHVGLPQASAADGWYGRRRRRREAARILLGVGSSRRTAGGAR